MTRAELEPLVDEDWRLFSAIATAWLDSHPAADADTRRNLAILRAMALGAGLSGGMDFDLLMHTLTQGKLAKLPLDAEVDAGPKTVGPINATHLDSLASVLLNAGYRKLALRTWKLIGRLGPIPEHVLGRIAAVEVVGDYSWSPRRKADAGGSRPRDCSESVSISLSDRSSRIWTGSARCRACRT